MASKSALIIGECHSDNVGDKAISKGLSLELESRGYITTCADFSCRDVGHKVGASPRQNTLSARLKRGIYLALPRSLQGAYWALKNRETIRRVASVPHDLVIIGGGQLVLSNATFAWALYLWVLYLSPASKKIYVLACGAGRDFSVVDRLLFGKALEAVSGVFLRDSASIENIRQVFNGPVSYCPDVAFLLSRHAGGQKMRNETKILGVSVMDYKVYSRYRTEVGAKPLSFDKYTGEWTKKIRGYLDDGYKVRCLSTTRADHHVTALIFQSVQKHKAADATVMEFRTDPMEFIDEVRKVDCYLSGRMHGLILAQMLGVTVIPFVVSEKIASYEAEYRDAVIDHVIARIDQVLESIVG